MDLRGRVNRKQVREGGGGGADLHFDEMIGSYELNIYRHRNNKIRGLDSLELRHHQSDLWAQGNHTCRGPAPRPQLGPPPQLPPHVPQAWRLSRWPNDATVGTLRSILRQTGLIPSQLDAL